MEGPLGSPAKAGSAEPDSVSDAPSLSQQTRQAHPQSESGRDHGPAKQGSSAATRDHADEDFSDITPAQLDADSLGSGPHNAAHGQGQREREMTTARESKSKVPGISARFGRASRIQTVAVVTACAAAAVCASWALFDRTGSASGLSEYRADTRSYTAPLWEAFRDYGAGKTSVWPIHDAGPWRDGDKDAADYARADFSPGLEIQSVSRKKATQSLRRLAQRRIVKTRGAGVDPESRQGTRTASLQRTTKYKNLGEAIEAYNLHVQREREKRRVLARKVALLKRLQTKLASKAGTGGEQAGNHGQSGSYINYWDRGSRAQSLEPVEGQRGKVGWGTRNPLTGVQRVECIDTVADGAKDANQFDDSKDAIRLRERFQGDVGDTYTVECPKNCGATGGSRATLFGCGTYLDSSSICKAALAEAQLGTRTSGYVSFKIVDPVEEYPGCRKDAFQAVPMPTSGGHISHVTSFGWEWPQWYKADKPSKLAAYGPEKCFLKYRTSCYKKPKHSSCYGMRAFQILETPVLDIPQPLVLPPSGTYIGNVNVIMLLPEDLRNLGQIRYTLDGSIPRTDSKLYVGPENLRALNGERSFTVKGVIWADALPFYGDIVTREYKIVPMMPGQCDDANCVKDAEGNTRLEPRGVDASTQGDTTETHPDAVDQNGAGDEEAPPVTVEEAGLEQEDEIMSLMHESVGKAIVSAPTLGERIFYTVDGSDPVPGGPGTFECGVNPGFDGSREQTRAEFMERETVKEPEHVPGGPQESEDGEAQQHLLAAEQAIMSFMTPNGCEMLLPPGKWEVKVVGVQNDCDGCPPVQPSKIAGASIDVPWDGRPGFDTAQAPMIDVFVLGPSGNGKSYPVQAGEVPAAAQDGSVTVALEQGEAAYAKMICPESRALPHYTVDDPAVDRFSPRPKGGVVALSNGEHVLASLCYMPTMNPSPVTSVKIAVSGGGDVDLENLAEQRAALESDSSSMIVCSQPNITLQESSGQHNIAEKSDNGGSNGREVFKAADHDSDGELEFDEWKALLAPIGDDEAKTKKLFDEVDVDHDGKISMEEYVNWVDSSPPRELKVLSDEIKNKVSPITGQRHDYEVDTIVMPVRGAYAKLECGGTCPNAVPHYTINSPQVNVHSPRPSDSLVPLTFGVNYIRAVCENNEMKVSEIASREVLVVPPGQCLPGTTGPGVPDCEQCAPGTFKPEGGDVACSECGRGMTSPAGAQHETDCECKPGYRSGEKEGSCEICEAGKYKDQVGVGACQECGSNSASPPGSTTAIECECNAGYTAGDVGACVACAAGTYKDALGPQVCTECPPNSASPNEASKFQTDCLCSPGYYGAAGKLPFVAGPDGTVARLPSPDPVDFPTYGDGNEPLCLPCPLGTYKEAEGGFSAAACSSCPDGTTSPEASVNEDQCVACDGPCPVAQASPDADDGTGTAQCPAGSELILGTTYSSASDCKCMAGHTGPDGGPCIACEAGKFKALVGAEACQGCPENTESPAGSLTHIDCVCKDGFGGLPGGPCTSPPPPPPSEPHWRETGVARACTLNGKACWFREQAKDCFTDEGQVCKYEGLQFLNMPGINWKPPGHPEHVQLALVPKPNKKDECDCLLIPVKENPDFFGKFLD